MPRYSAGQREDIRRTVRELVLLHVRPMDILRYLSEKQGVVITRRQLEYYMAEVKQEFKDAATFDREEQIGTAMNRLHDLYRKCIQAEKYQTALTVQKDINELLGIKAPAKLEHTGQTLEDWILQQSKEWKAGVKADGGGPAGGHDLPPVTETNH